MQEEKRSTGAMLQQMLSESTIALYTQLSIIIQTSYGMYDPKTKTVKRCNIAQFDECRTHVGDDNLTPGTVAIG
eukprot:13418911-Ditylum_brightwellii.AAC.1